MAKTNTSPALALVASPGFKVVDAQLAQLQSDAVSHYLRMAEIAKQRDGLRYEESLRGVVLGVELLRIQASLPYGQWGKWCEKHLPNLGSRWINYLMALALVFLAKAKITKPVQLALPGEQTALLIDGPASDSALMLKKAQKFVAEKSLSELLAEHEIKKAKLGGKRTPREDGDDEPKAPATPEQRALQTAEELGAWLTQGRQLLIKENVCQHLPADQIRAFADSLNALRTDFRAGLGNLLKQADTAK